MAIIHEIIGQVQDEALRVRLLDEYNRLSKRKKFGLVYERHLPERTLLYDLPVKRGSLVALKNGEIKECFEVRRIENGVATCVNTASGELSQIEVDKLVVAAQFGEPIYPYLISQDKVENAPDSDLWHQLIEADNFHALQLLDYLYRGKVDCIYIDPPYNTGARDWKYNNDYVDKADAYRHSKWLAMMEKRLRLAKRLLNPENSVLIVTIDEKEYLHLGCLLEEIFAEAEIQMISSVINPAGVTREGSFSRTDEYLFFVKLGSAAPSSLHLSDDWRGNIKGGYKDKLRWNGLHRSGTNARRIDRPNLFYPLYISNDGKRIVKIGDSIPLITPRGSVESIEDTITIWPIRSNGEEGNWQISQDRLRDLYAKGYVKLGRFTQKGMSISYLKSGEQTKIENGMFDVIGNLEDGSVVVDTSGYQAKFVPGTQWWIKSHDATQLGTKVLNNILGENRFSFPKSIYAVHDALRFFVADKPNALIVDFFAGSGTTLHAVNLLNKEDGGKRRCIMVTNNEVSEEEADSLTAQGFKPGDYEWERLGIARYVAWPRTTCSIKGVDVNGQPISGEYLTYLTETKSTARKIKQLSLTLPSGREGKALKKQIVALLGKKQLAQSLVTDDCPFIVSESYPSAILFDSNQWEDFIEALDGQEQIREIIVVTDNNRRFAALKSEIENSVGTYEETVPVTFPMADGFEANVEFFKLGFLDKNAIALGRQFREILPLLWLKAGATGKCPKIETEALPDMLVLAENGLAVLIDTVEVETFLCQVVSDHINTVYIVSDSEQEYMEIARRLGGKAVYQLYRDYLDNFRINIEK